MLNKGWLGLFVLFLVLTILIPVAVSAGELSECSFEELSATGGFHTMDFTEISDHAFQNAQGISVVTQVSGDNNTITLPITINIILVNGDYCGDIYLDYIDHQIVLGL